MSKKRAMITVDSEQWDRVQALLREQEYPPGAMSVYLGACLDDLEARLNNEPSPLAVGPFFELEVHKKGLAAALVDRGVAVFVDEGEKPKKDPES